MRTAPRYDGSSPVCFHGIKGNRCKHSVLRLTASTGSQRKWPCTGKPKDNIRQTVETGKGNFPSIRHEDVSIMVVSYCISEYSLLAQKCSKTNHNYPLIKCTIDSILTHSILFYSFKPSLLFYMVVASLYFKPVSFILIVSG